MDLHISLVDGAQYTSKASSLPFTYRVTFDEPAVVVGSLDVNTCMLVNTEDEEITAGGGVSVLRKRDGEFNVGPDAPLVAEANALADQEDLGVLCPGTYQLVAEVTVFLKQPTGGVQARSLRSSLHLTLA